MNLSIAVCPSFSKILTNLSHLFLLGSDDIISSVFLFSTQETNSFGSISFRRNDRFRLISFGPTRYDVVVSIKKDKKIETLMKIISNNNQNIRLNGTPSVVLI